MSTPSSSLHQPPGSLFAIALCTALAYAAFLLPSSAHAQQVSAQDSAAAPADKPTRRLGETTSALLQAQANGSLAGASLPMLGATATLSWQRYLDSYKHPIPETFTRKLDEISTR